MSIAKSGLSAIGRLAALGLFAGAFLFGLAGVVYMSLQGSEVKVPEITGKNFSDSEKELALLGLKIKKRADRVSTEAPNTVIEQLPKPGDTVKTGQMILVVTSKAGDVGDAPASLKKADEDDTEKIEEMISDKPKKAKTNSNTAKKKADTTRDLLGDNSATNSNSNSDTADSNSNKKEPGTNNNSEKTNKSTPTPPGNRQTNPGTKPGASETRPRTPVKP